MGGSVPTGADLAGDPLGRGVRFGLGGGPGHVREGGLPPELVGDAIVAILAAGGCAAGRRPRVLICHLVALDSMVRWDPADGDLVASSEDAVTGLHRRDGEALAWANDVGPHPVDGGCRVDEDSVAVAALLASVQDANGSPDGEYLCVKDLLVCTEVVAASGPVPVGRPLDDRRPHLLAVEA